MKINSISLQPLRSQINGIEVVHEVDALYKIIEITKKFKPELIIELGTSWGGMTLLFHEIDRNIPIYSFDIKSPRNPNKSLFNKNVKFVIEDIIGGRQDLKKAEKLDKNNLSQKLIDLCKDKRKKLLYCDNGHKIYEVLYYGSQLNEGDMIGIHDWNKEISDDWNKIKYVDKRCTREEHEELKKVLKSFNNVNQFVNSWFAIK